MDDIDLRTVTMRYPDKENAGSFHPRRNTELWLSMLENILSFYEEVTVEITQDSYAQITKVKVIFASVEDATLFRLRDL